MFYDDLRRASAYAPVLGKFVTLESYFSDAGSSDRIRNSPPTNIARPICSRRPSAASRMRFRDGCAISAAAARPMAVRQSPRWSACCGRRTSPTASCEPKSNGVNCRRPRPTRPPKLRLDQRLAERLSQSVAQLSAALPREKKSPQRGYLIVNPASYKRRVLVDLPELSTLPGDELPVLATEEQRRQAPRDCRVAAGRFCLGGAGRRSADPRMVGRSDRFELAVAQRALRGADSSGNRRNPIDSRL